MGRFVSVDPLNEKYPELSSYQYASNRPITMIDLDGLEGVIRIHGSWLKERVAQHYGDGNNFERVFNAFRAAVSGTGKTLNDIPEKERKSTEKDWGGNSPATFTPDSEMEGFKVIYGVDDKGNEQFFNINFSKFETNLESQKGESGIWESFSNWAKSTWNTLVGNVEKAIPMDDGIQFTWSNG